MKKQYVCAVENSSAVCDKIFEDDALWVFVNYKISPDEDQFGQKYNNTKAAKEKIQKGIKMAIGEAGRILVEYKYLSAGREYVWDLGVRYDYSQGSKVESKLMCGYGLTLPQEIMGLIDKYCKEVGQLHELMCQLIDVKNKLSIQEATDLWNEA